MLIFKIMNIDFFRISYIYNIYKNFQSLCHSFLTSKYLLIRKVYGQPLVIFSKGKSF
jgi:hypothetical protein